MKRYIEALGDLNLAIKLKPEVGAFHATRGFVLVELDRLPEALLSFEQFLKSPNVNFDDGKTATEVKMAHLLTLLRLKSRLKNA